MSGGLCEWQADHGDALEDLADDEFPALPAAGPVQEVASPATAAGPFVPPSICMAGGPLLVPVEVPPLAPPWAFPRHQHVDCLRQLTRQVSPGGQAMPGRRWR